VLVVLATEIEASSWAVSRTSPQSEQLERFLYLDPGDLAVSRPGVPMAPRSVLGCQLGTLRNAHLAPTIVPAASLIVVAPLWAGGAAGA
jgi:hypothetical protein